MELHSTPTFPQTLSGFDLRRTPTLRTDVLVIGGGIAGGSAAIAAAEAGASVLLLSKTALTETNTNYAQGGIAAVLGGDDNYQLHLGDTCRVGKGLVDAQLAQRIIDEGPAAVAWMQSLQAIFDADADGGLSLSREGGHSVQRVVHANGDATGAEMQRAIAARLAADPNIQLRSPAFVQDLLVKEGRCVGALINFENMTLAVEAGAVVLASGGAGQIYRETTNPVGACGDGVALAFRAGAVISDMEFVQFHPTTLYIAGASRFLISEVIRGAGATLRDRNGNRFMDDVHEMAELAPRDVVSRAILEQMVRTGDTHVYLDLSTVKGSPKTRFPSIARICQAFDIDVDTDPIPVRPGAHYFIGGVRTDRSGRSSVAGLFVTGEAASTSFHGANRLASNSLLEGVVMGRCVGALAAEDCGSGGTLPKACAAPEPVLNPPRIHVDDMLYSLKSLMWREVGLERTAKGMQEAHGRIGFWNHYLMRSRPATLRGFELVNMLTTSALVATAALQRQESRGTHFRSDHPTRDDANWCRSILLQRDTDGSIASELSPLRTPSDDAASNPQPSN